MPHLLDLHRSEDNLVAKVPQMLAGVEALEVAIGVREHIKALTGETPHNVIDIALALGFKLVLVLDSTELGTEKGMLLVNQGIRKVFHEGMDGWRGRGDW